jgi:hypothetical protein
MDLGPTVPRLQSLVEKSKLPTYDLAFRLVRKAPESGQPGATLFHLDC